MRYTKLNGTDQVYYKIISEYPVKTTTTELNQRLEAKGWQPLDKDWLNPKIPTSHVRGWTDFTDNTTKPNQKACLWNSYWTNSKNDMLNFVLRYNDPLKAKPNITELNVIGIYIPGKLAKQTIEQVNEYKKSMGKNEKNL